MSVLGAPVPLACWAGIPVYLVLIVRFNHQTLKYQSRELLSPVLAGFESQFYRPSHLNSLLILNFTGVEKTQDDLPQNGFEKDAATGPMAGDVIVCFAN